MAVTIDATAEGVDANSYGTLAEAEVYHDSRLHNSEWLLATDEDKKRALVWATRTIEVMFNWYGNKTTVNQKLSFPRSGIMHDSRDLGYDYINTIYIIPEDIKNAEFELAFDLIQEDKTASRDDEGIKRFKVDVLEFEFDKTDKKKNIPDKVMYILNRYGQSVTENRINTILERV